MFRNRFTRPLTRLLAWLAMLIAMSGFAATLELDALLQSSEQLKHDGRWEDNLVLVREGVLQAQDEGDQEKELVLTLQAVSTAFYLGDYDLAGLLAESANQLAGQLKSKDPGKTRSEIESLYLLSAVARARHHDREAVARGEQALALCREALNPGDILEAKVRFNLGAALTDAKTPDLVRGISQLEQAQAIFVSNNNSSDTLRVALRLARANLMLEQPDKAEAILLKVKNLLESPRNLMLYQYQWAKVCFARGRIKEAETVAAEAEQLAVKLNASKDLERIKTLQQQLAASVDA
ncbi:hypothetical protein ACWJJH_01015 [Endozoicomonadaceae bacterium StTr2]